MPIELSSFSRFNGTEAFIRDGKEVFGRWARPDFLNEDKLNENDISKVFIDNTLAGRPDLIANQAYGTPFLEWVIIMFNNPKDLLGWPKAGTVIKVVNKNKIITNV